MLQDMVRQKVQDALKKYQDTTNKKTSEDTETSKYTHRGLQQTTQ
jgi:DNA-binding protein YbaB